MQQKTTDKVWIDESNQKIPFIRVTKLERLKEKSATKLFNEAKKVSDSLAELKKLVSDVCSAILEEHYAELGITPEKRGIGNYTWYNFDGSIKIIVKVNIQIGFDDMIIETAKVKFDEFLSNNIESKVDFAKELVMNAFETSKGGFDVKKVMSLLRYKSRVSDPTFQEAMTLLENSIRRKNGKTYFQIFEKDESGEYKIVPLDFASL